LIGICLLINLTHSQYAPDFTASFYELETGLLGALTGTVYYSQTYKAIRYDYDPAGSYYEIYNYNTTNANNLFTYKACSNKCDIVSEAANVVQPIFNYQSGDTCSPTASTTAYYGACHLCTSPSESVTS
jgi:hypothetical protein